MNSLFDSNSGKLHCAKEGSEGPAWPAGTRMPQCEQTASGHWLLGVGHWDEVIPVEVARVHKIRNAPLGS